MLLILHNSISVLWNQETKKYELFSYKNISLRYPKNNGPEQGERGVLIVYDHRGIGKEGVTIFTYLLIITR